MAQQTTADINVIALIGERGREVSEFIQQDLGPTGMKKSVLVVATSDEPAILRIHAAHTATAIAEYFRGHGKNVLLLMDSLSRYALAQREIGLAAGEPPTTKGFPPSVFSSLPRLVERAGTNDRGSITAFYTVLVEGDDLEEPISDTTRGILDGHIVLSRSLAARGHYPSIDVLQSLSRLMDQIVPQTQLVAAQSIRALLAAYQDHEDMISIGAYRSGSNRQVDMAIILRDEINRYLRQDATDACTMTDAREALIRLAEKCAATSVTAVANSDASTAKIS
jgi:flagellum-specific ATP synthase